MVVKEVKAHVCQEVSLLHAEEQVEVSQVNWYTERNASEACPCHSLGGSVLPLEDARSPGSRGEAAGRRMS